MNPQQDTIAALATPPGEGGLAVIRVSGPAALQIVDRCFRASGKRAGVVQEQVSHTLRHGWITQEDRDLDEVLVAVMRGPRSFTGEDVVEVSCHGGSYVSGQVLEVLFRCGARAAEPGEFSRRAFLNGRLDLAQAEAVADVIHASTEWSLSAAREQLKGSLSRRVELLRGDLMGVLAHLEAYIDFPDEDIDPDTGDAFRSRMEAACLSLDQLLATADEGRMLREGIQIAIVGRPNAGKSSLLNALLGEDRAIVTPQAGTTRDVLREAANIRGIPVWFLDTAGLRESGDAIELEGMRRAAEMADRADLVLHVMDSSSAGEPDLPEETVSRWSDRRLVVWNKSDLQEASFPDRLPQDPLSVCISCLTGEGLDLLRDRIRERAGRRFSKESEGGAAINARHKAALFRAREALVQALDSLARGEGPELCAMDLRVSVQAVGEVVGHTSTDDLLDAIFSTFCLGK